MAQTSTATDLSIYYENLKKNGYLLTDQQAQRLSKAVLWSLGLNMSGKLKKQLAKQLPEELATQLTRAFWLLHFRDKSMPEEIFLKEVAKRSGNTDPHFAKHPTLAVFHEIKGMIDSDLSDEIADDLAPEIAALWERA